jgi:peptidoglycan-associated lipoprotein
MRILRQYYPLLFVCALLLPGCGKKRPPAVATSGANQGSEATNRPGETLPAEPDIRQQSETGLGGENLGTDSEEGGPLADIHFEYDQAGLTDQARGILEKHALWLQAHRDTKVSVEGHCDERGTVEYNLALGDKRAQAAREYLGSLGVAKERLSTVSFGKEKPLEGGHDESAWSKNRRVHFRVSR